MKNPKWREAYPQGHKVKYGGKFLTTWSGYSLSLEQTNGGTISAQRNRGYEDDEVPMSYTANQDCYFNGWSANEGSFVGNNYKFGTNDATAKASFINTSPDKLLNLGTTKLRIVGDYSNSAGYDGTGQRIYLDGTDSENTQRPLVYLPQISGAIKNKNYFVLKFDLARNLGEGNYWWIHSGTNAGVYLVTRQNAVENYTHSFVPELEGFLGAKRDSLTREEGIRFATVSEPMYNNDGARTATSIENASIPSGNTSTASLVPLKTYAKHFNHGRLGTYTETFSGYFEGKYTLQVNASGKWNYNGYCYEPTTYEDGEWKSLKYVFDMNTFAYSSYIGDECVYKQTNTKTWEKTSDAEYAATIPGKMYAVHNIDSRLNAYWYTQWNGTSSTYRNVGCTSARNISMTYFDTCEQANMWAQHN